MRFLKVKRAAPISDFASLSSGEFSTLSRNGSPAKPSSILKGINETVGGDDTKSVKFDDSVKFCNKIAANDRHNKACWYTPEEIEKSATSAKSLCSSIRRCDLEKQYISIVSDLYEFCSKANDEKLLETGHLDSSEENRLVEAMIHTDIIGLERLVVALLYHNYKSQRKAIMTSLKQVQQAIPSSDMRVETIRRTVQSLSLPHRVFARIMGKACQNAVLSGGSKK